MKNRVYEFIKQRDLTQIKEIAEELKMKQTDVLNCVNELQMKGYVEVIPVPLSETTMNSCYYRVTYKNYEE